MVWAWLTTNDKRPTTLLLLQIADGLNHGLDLVGRHTLGSERVSCLLIGAAVGDKVRQVGIRQFLGFVGDQAGNLGCRFSGSVRPVADGALRLENGRSVLRPGQAGDQDE